MLSGVLVGLASIGAVASYFSLDWSELYGFMMATLVFVAGIVVLALVAVVLVKLTGRLLRKLTGGSQDDNSGNQE